MAVRSCSAYVGIYSDISLRSAYQLHGWSDKRIRRISITEEAPCVGLPRRVSECTAEITNDFGTNGSGWTGPAMSAVAVVDPAEMVGTFMQVYIAIGQLRGPYVYIIDSVEATDDGATIHGLGVDSLLDKTFDEAGLGDHAIAAGTSIVGECADLMTAAGFASVVHPSSTAAVPSAVIVPGEAVVGDVARALALGAGYAVALESYPQKGAIGPLNAYPMTAFGGAYGWPEPYQTGRIGTLVVTDPVYESSQEVVIDSSQAGTMQVEAPLSSLVIDWSTVQTWAKWRTATQWYAVDIPGDPYSIRCNLANAVQVYRVVLPVAQWTSGGVTYTQRMLVERVDTTYDGGISQRVYGPLYDVI